MLLIYSQLGSGVWGGVIEKSYATRFALTFAGVSGSVDVSVVSWLD